MPPAGRLGPAGVGRHDEAITPIIGTMLVFVVIFGGMAGALVFGVPAIKGLQDRAAVDDMATQLQAVRREAERLTAEGVGASVAMAPSQGSINLEEGTRMAVAISYDGTASQQGLALAWGKGGKKKNASNAAQDCDAHLQDWADGDNTVRLVASDCSTPMLWVPADAGTGSTLVQTLAAGPPVTASGWTGATQANLIDSDNAYATYATSSPVAGTNDLRATLANPGSTPDTVTEVIVKAEVSILPSNPNNSPDDGFKLKVCLQGGACSVDSQRAGSAASDTVVSFDVSRKHPNGNNVAWSWADMSNLEAGVELAQQGGGAGGRDGTWRVDRIWVEVTSEPASGNDKTGRCYNTSGAACLQGVKTSDAAGTNRVTAITTVSTDTYLLTLDAPLVGDWYFQLSKDPRVPDVDQLLAKVYVFDMARLRWVRDQGLATWLEGGAVFATRGGTHYLHSPPIFDESITGRLLGNLTYYVRIIRFQGDEASISGTGTTSVLLRHNSTLSTTNDGIVGARFDFDGEGADLWCNALMRRDVPDNYYYAEHEFDDDGAGDKQCDGHPATGVQGVKYGAQSTLCNGLTDPQLTQCRRNNPLIFQMLFTEVLFDVALRP